MADNTQIVDHILKQEGQGTYNVYFKDLTDTDKQSIQAWLKDNIQYNDVQGAPGLPSDNKAYDENNNIKPFDKLAFTADYDDLNNAPTIPDIEGERPTAFNPIAFTGVVNLDNVAVSNVINLSEYSINSNDAEHVAGMTASDISDNNTKLQNIGSSDSFVKGLNAFQKNGNGILLFNTLQSKIISGGFLITKTPTYLVSNSGIYFLTDVKNTTWDGPTLQYFELHLVAVTDSNYTTIRTYETNITDEAAEEILENIELTAKNVILIFDFNNNILYCKTKEIGREQEQGILEETDPIFAVSVAANITNEDITNWNNKSNFSGNYENLNGAPILATVATSGNYNDLINKPQATISLEGFTNLNISTEENNKLKFLGNTDVYILNYNNFLNSSDMSLKDVFLNSINKYLQTPINLTIKSALYNFLVNNIQSYSPDGEEAIYYILNLLPINNCNYATIRYDLDSFNESIANQQLQDLTITEQSFILVIDTVYNVLYFKKK